eukprot:CAMPEP_0184514564 /NCGR_PEP_ID=MMETSP0198_2-20121128/4034_1 /TAXON_ID=1112570 /ORGANISM="Thraustochytrium sp., Strain LLF1b" /LENGTH=672 /DNA_ID=CAMNT_0026904769 /DNA_START=137 /DNA_END=2155 /DNA_ORIENTATION=+
MLSKAARSVAVRKQGGAAVRRLATGAPAPPSAGAEPKSGGAGLGRLLLLTAIVAPPLYGAFLTREDPVFRASFKEKLPGLYEALVPLLKLDDKKVAAQDAAAAASGQTSSASPLSSIMETLKESAPAVHDAVKNVVDKVTGNETLLDGIPVTSLKAELEALSKRWDQAGDQQIRFSKEEVSALEKVVEKAQAEAKGKAAAEAVAAAEAKVKAEASKTTTDANANEETAASKTALATEASASAQPTSSTSSATPSGQDTKESQTSSSQHVKSAEEEQVAVAPARATLDALREKARKVRTRAGESAAEHIKGLEKDLRDDLEVVLSKDLTHLDEEGLRRRIVQLVLEIKDRNRWEALRMHELTKKHTEELVAKYDSLLQEQSDKYEELIRFESNAAAIRASEEAQIQANDHTSRLLQTKEQQWQNATQQMLDRQKQSLAAEFEQRFKEAKAQIEGKASEELKSRVNALNAIKKRVAELQDALASRTSHEDAAKTMQNVSLAVLDAQDVLQKHPQQIGAEISRLEALGSSNAVVKAALASIPARARTQGVASQIELVQRFGSVYDTCFQVALVPENAGVLECAAARVVSALSFRTPQPAQEETPNTVQNSQEKALARAQYYLVEQSDLAAAVKEMESLEGRVREVANDWIVSAKDRIAVEQALHVVKTHVAVQSS